MTEETKQEITEISKQFADGFKPNIPQISGSGWLIVDPLSSYLSFCGYENTIIEIPKKDNLPQILIIEFKDGSRFIPAGSDLASREIDNDLLFKLAKDWMWI